MIPDQLLILPAVLLALCYIFHYLVTPPRKPCEDDLDRIRESLLHKYGLDKVEKILQHIQSLTIRCDICYMCV